MKAFFVLMGFVATTASAQELAPAWTVATPKDAAAVLSFEEGSGSRIHLQCVRKSGQVVLDFEVARRLADHKVGEVWVDASGIAAPWPVSVALASGTSTTTLRGQTQPAETLSVTLVKTEISTAAPVIKAFAKSGVFSLRALNGSISPSAAKPGWVRKFLRACN